MEQQPARRSQYPGPRRAFVVGFLVASVVVYNLADGWACGFGVPALIAGALCAGAAYVLRRRGWGLAGWLVVLVTAGLASVLAVIVVAEVTLPRELYRETFGDRGPDGVSIIEARRRGIKEPMMLLVVQAADADGFRRWLAASGFERDSQEWWADNSGGLHHSSVPPLLLWEVPPGRADLEVYHRKTGGEEAPEDFDQTLVWDPTRHRAYVWW